VTEAPDAVVVGSGPNGLAAAVTLAAAGLRVHVIEGAPRIGGGCRTAELTLPGFRHDVCSAAHPLAVASPFFRRFGLAARGVTLLEADVQFAQPLDGGRAAVVTRSVDETAARLGTDAASYRRLFAPLALHCADLCDVLLAPLRRPPARPAAVAPFALRAALPAAAVARRWHTPEARAILAGAAAHAMLPLTRTPTAGVGLMLTTLAHAVGWPFAAGGSERITDALASAVTGAGGVVETGRWVRSLAELPPARAVLLDVSPRSLDVLAGETLPGRYRDSLRRFGYGFGICKTDFALSGPVPWANADCRRAGTLHLGGAFAEIAAAEAEVAAGRHPERPYVLVTQPGVVDPSRAPAGQHTLWAYCHVPSGSTVDMTDRIEAQLERFAPGFHDLILAKATRTAADTEARNPNYVGGDIGGGAQTLFQTIFRPAPRWNPYRTPLRGVYLCSSATPPMPGVHGRCGELAALTALRDVFGVREAPYIGPETDLPGIDRLANVMDCRNVSGHITFGMVHGMKERNETGQGLSRRNALRLGALTVGVPSLLAATGAAAGAATTPSGTRSAAASPAGSPYPPGPPVPDSYVVTDFPLDRVTLKNSLFALHRDLMLEFADNYPVDNMLYNFRANAGLPNPPGAVPVGGWDTPTGNLRGHSTGHFMTLLAQAYAGGGGEIYKQKLDYLVQALGQCQDALNATVGQPGGPSHLGYLAAYPETQFILLEQYATYPTIWAPWYTCHMIMRGLLDAYRLTGSLRALDIVMGMADWAHSRLAHLPRTQLDNMWKIYIAGEYNAMPVVLAELYSITGNEDCLVTAECFVNTYLFVAGFENDDILDGEHANQHIPQYQGYLRIYDYAKETDYYTRPDYYTSAANFWDMVVPHRIYVDGGMAGVGEIFGARDVIAGTIGASNAEGCPLYNMLKLSRSLFFHDPDPKYMEYFERGLYGQIISRRQDAHSESDPLVTYFLDVDPGAVREYAGNLGDCDGGTGPEDATKFQESIYFRSVDSSALYVNLYMASVLDWAERGFTISQSTDYPLDPSGDVTIGVDGSGPLDIKLRVPYWVQQGFTVRVNGRRQHLDAAAGTYVTISRSWRPGDTIQISMPFSLRMERTLDEPQTQTIAYGPIPLVAQSSSTSYLELSFYQDFTLAGDLTHAITPADEPMTFTANGYTLAPFYEDNALPYHVYFHRSEPMIVFGTVDSGVTNYADSDGFTFLDRLWAQAPFASDSQFSRAVATLAAQWAQDGLLTSAEESDVVSAAGQAHLGH
jgi:phytoene dehydrogenase-like protein/DUF1680 family protein